MPRRRPGAIRAAQPRHPDHPSPPVIPGIGQESRIAIEIAGSRTRMSDVTGALDRYRHFLRKPGRWRYLSPEKLPCCDPAEARDELETVLRALPPRARAELRRVITPIDREYWRRTLPDPRASEPREAWWRNRLHEW